MRFIKRLSVIPFLLLIGLIGNISAQNPNWIAPNGANYSFSANVIATNYLDGIKSDNANDRIAFFVGSELRGLSTPILIGNLGYFHYVTIFSNLGEEEMSIKMYHQSSDLVYEAAIPFGYQAQSINGSIDNPLIMNFYTDNDAPIYLTDVPLQQTIEGLAFEEIDMADYLVQVDSQGVSWSYTFNPNLNASFNGSVLAVSGAPGFSGSTSLIVRATELPPSAQSITNAQSKVALLTTQIAEKEIFYDITPIYDGPAWNPIPSQGIVLGEQFDTTNLHDYEYQYGGPAIKYDYSPVLVENFPAESIPNWTFNNTYATNMTIIARLDYTPKYQFAHSNDILAAYIDNEIHGVATRNETTGLYHLVIGDYINGRPITIKFYSDTLKQIITLDSILNYATHQILGSIENPYVFEFAPLVPQVPDNAIPGGFAVMPIQIVDSQFLGTMTFDFFALDPLYPDYLKDETQASYCVVATIGELTIYYADMDEDGLGDPNVYILACSATEGYVENGDDCDDTSATDPSLSISIVENSGIPDDGNICPNSSVTLTATTQSNYLWSTGDTTQTISVNPASSTEYSVSVTLISGCKISYKVLISTEGKVVLNSSNSGFGTLRNILECIAEGDTITFNQPSIGFTLLTEPLIITKNVSLLGLNMSQRPEIRMDFNATSNGLEIESNKTLKLENLDLRFINPGNNPTIMGSGEIRITGITHVTKQL